jgi:hypothetical protein
VVLVEHEVLSTRPVCLSVTGRGAGGTRGSVYQAVALPCLSKRHRYKTVREIVCLERMHRAFETGLMRYGMMKAVKLPVGAARGRAEAQPALASSS